MSDFYVFGTFILLNTNYPSDKTSRQASAKFRTQNPIDESVFVSNADVPTTKGEWMALGGSNLVYISDVDYLIRTDEQIGDENWIMPYSTSAGYPHAAGYFPRQRFKIAEPLPFDPNATNPNGDRFIKPVPTPKPLVLPEFIHFAEERLELGYDYGAVGGAAFSTTVIEVADDREQRNSQKHLPLHRYQLGDRVVAESQVRMLAEISQIKNFHAARLGRFEGFRYKDWADYKSEDKQILAIGDGNTTKYQLFKIYRAGDAKAYRPILKPVPGMVNIYEDGILAADVVEDPKHGWHINIETGVITRASPLPDRVYLRVSFEFDTPVWFENDNIDFSLQYYDRRSEDEVYRLGSIFVVERRMPTAIPWDIYTKGEMDQELDLGIVYDTVESFSFSNTEQALLSGYTKTENKTDDARVKFNLGSKKLNRAELDLLLGYFWNARGKNGEWKFKNKDNSYIVRFDQDQLNLKFEVANDSDALFSLSGLKISVQESNI